MGQWGFGPCESRDRVIEETFRGHLEPEIGAVDGLACTLHFILIYDVMLINLLHCILPLLSPQTHPFTPH